MTFYGAELDQDDVYHYTSEMLSLGLNDDLDRVVLEDSGGTDWFDFSATGGNIVSDMSAGNLSAAELLDGGIPTGGITTLDGVTIVQIADGTLIENAVAGDGNDTLIGNSVANELYGMRGDDTLYGDLGGDTLNGGQGSDTLWGGAGNDLFVFTLGDGTDWLGDFTAGLGLGDQVALYGYVGLGFGALVQLDDGSGNAMIDLGGGDALIFADVNVGALVADDFLFFDTLLT